MSSKNHQQKNRPRVTYKTPGRTCQHADAGCCPLCMDPLKPRRIAGFHMKMPKGIRRHINHNS